MGIFSPRFESETKRWIISGPYENNIYIYIWPFSFLKNSYVHFSLYVCEMGWGYSPFHAFIQITERICDSAETGIEGLWIQVPFERLMDKADHFPWIWTRPTDYTWGRCLFLLWSSWCIQKPIYESQPRLVLTTNMRFFWGNEAFCHLWLHFIVHL